MAIELKTLKKLEYNEMLTLSVIESDEDLSSIFKEATKIPFSMIRTLYKEGKLTDDINETLRGLFDAIIVKKEKCIGMYLRLASAEGMVVTESEPITKNDGVSEGVTEGVTDGVKPVKEKEGILLRRYGKVRIERDIANQGGIATPVQVTGLKVNKLKNWWLSIDAWITHDLQSKNPKLTEEDYRTIDSVIGIVDQRINPIKKRTKHEKRT